MDSEHLYATSTMCVYASWISVWWIGRQHASALNWLHIANLNGGCERRIQNWVSPSGANLRPSSLPRGDSAPLLTSPGSAAGNDADVRPLPDHAAPRAPTDLCGLKILPIEALYTGPRSCQPHQRARGRKGEQPAATHLTRSNHQLNQMERVFSALSLEHAGRGRVCALGRRGHGAFHPRDASST